MKANELRIGNWILSKDMPVQIEEIKAETLRYCFGEFPISYIKPIYLNEQWLIKFGFENFHKRDFQKRGLFITTYFATPQTLVDDDFGNKRVLKLEYVHQLQNLYFALTGEELTLNSNP